MTVVATNPPAGHRLARTGPRRIACLLAVYGAALGWTLLVQLPLLHLDRIDEAFFVEVAHLWIKGALPYASSFDVKPPGFFALIAASQWALGPGPASARAVGIALDAVTATALFYLGRRCDTRVGVFAASVYPPLAEFVSFNDFYSALEATTTLAFLAAMSPLQLGRRAALTGLAAGAAFCVKQTAAFEAAVLFFAIVRARDAADRRTWAACTFAYGAGIVPLGFLVYFACHGAGRDLIDDAILGALMRPASPAEGLTFGDGLRLFLPLHRTVLGLMAFACLASIRRSSLAQAASGTPVALLEAWLLAALLATLAQRSMHVAYVSQALPPALLLASLCVVHAIPELGRTPGWARLGGLAALSLAPALAALGAHRTNRHPTRAIAEATSAIRATKPSSADKLFAVNGDGLWLNAATGLDPPTRYFHPSHTLCDFDGRGGGNLVGALAASPRYIVVADRRARLSCEQPERWSAIDATVRDSYRLITRAADEINSYDVYERIRTGGG